MTLPVLQFVRRGQTVTLRDVPPERTLLEVLREDLGCTGTKEGCAEGDCGACTVVVGEPEGDTLRYSAVNSCIRLAHSVQGLALWTVEDLARDPLIEREAPAVIHPAQAAMVSCHGSQCGFCTPGFVMSLFGMYQNRVCQGQSVTRELAQHDLSGNLCRCTGYRPILDAAQQMEQLPRAQVNEAAVLAQLQSLKPPVLGDAAYLAPRSLAELLQARAAHPQAQIVAGGTDVGLWVTKQFREFGRVLDVTRVAELREISDQGEHLAIGAAATLTQAFEALLALWPQLDEFAARFAGLPVRNAGTLGGNVANGSPIGDSMPLLIALRAQVVLASLRGERRLPLEEFYTGYRQNQLAADELLVRIEVPKPRAGDLLRVYKVSKRTDDDISAVCLAIQLTLQGGQVQAASIGVGGVAATPVRARATEAVLTGAAWNETSVVRAADTLRGEFQPLSDMRASSDYRRALLAHLLERYWRESTDTASQLATLRPLAQAAAVQKALA
ncbi:xanthine dehydrogenase small subunit [Comamonas endophytica]|uniref:Xanthine dehydrogenase small subunit n=1 Tax=Comamonas endophytica TaxID=2949090 RepID=A0ABY6G7L6_9BURK|nr:MULTISPECIES: xanthine dehydrogenase small subunit [unclassified Acidovorax]MCD2511517.1 xanthine dehydrogenase small subunit [Acidovorax sp. D4N7]UYG50903.1 xanthine dehydrogenase small subunit [Acidovorax sp. 5MLIR]